MMRVRFQLLLLLGIVFLASVSVSFAAEHSDREECLKTCDEERNPYQQQVCEISCSLIPERNDEEEGGKHSRPQPRPHKEHGEEDERDERDERRPRPHKPHHESRDEQDEGQDSESESPRQRNPFHFSSNRFHTLYSNHYGQIRVLQRFDKRSSQLQNLRDYRILEFRSKPRTLLLPHHDDAELLLFVLSGRAIITFVNPEDRDSYTLEHGDAIRIPAGTSFYLVNPEDNENLRIIKLALPVNNPRRIQSFFLSSTDEQQSYLEGFSKNVLEASFVSQYKEINRVLFGGENGRELRQKLEGVIVEISNEQIRELRRHAKSSSRKTISSEDEPFNLRSRKPVYSNNYGKLYEITPEKNPQLRELDVLISCADIYQGGFMLPHYHSKATLILKVNKGDAEVEIVGPRQERQQQEQEPRQVRRYRAELSEDDILVVPAGYPFVVNATSNLRLFAFGINAEDNQRNFLAGEKDNLLRQLHRPVKDLAFPESAEDFDELIQNQRDSCFADAQPQQVQGGRKGSKGPLSSILNALY